MTKKRLIALVFCLTVFSFKQDEGISNNFNSGEFMKFKIYYNLFPFTAGYATLNVSDVTFNGVPHYFVDGGGRTSGIFRMFPVDDIYQTYINKNTMLPTKFVRNISEGKFKKNIIQYFDHEKKEVKVVDNIDKTTKIYKSSKNIQDMISAFYYLRTMDFNDKKAGDFVSFDVFMDEEIYPFKMKILGRELKKTKFGKINCLKLQPYFQKGRVFKAEEGITFWVTDDKNHFPVEVKADLLVGSLKAELIEYRNEKYNFDFK